MPKRSADLSEKIQLSDLFDTVLEYEKKEKYFEGLLLGYRVEKEAFISAIISILEKYRENAPSITKALTENPELKFEPPYVAIYNNLAFARDKYLPWLKAKTDAAVSEAERAYKAQLAKITSPYNQTESSITSLLKLFETE